MRLVIIHGSAGIGKTSLRRMVVNLARVRGLEVLELDANVASALDQLSAEAHGCSKE